MNFELLEWNPVFTADVARFANNKKIADNLRDVFPHPYTLSDAEAYIDACMRADETRQCCRALVVDGIAAGSIGIFLKDDVYAKSGELGYWLGEPFWGQGMMTEAIRTLCSLAFARYDLVRIFAEPYAHNFGSRRVLEKAGFALEGVMRQSICKNGQIYDSCLYALLRDA